jgi:zinc transporter ZupT
MIIAIFFLFFSVTITGFLILSGAYKNKIQVKSLLIFGGAYLFSITIIHLLPEVFEKVSEYEALPYFVLLGFFFQLLLEQFSQGAEHGHIHISGKASVGISRPILLLLSLSIHAFLEGTLLAQPEVINGNHNSNALLIGIILHKIPAAIALVTVLITWLNSKVSISIYLIIFALASPLGLLTSHYLNVYNLITEDQLMILFAVVSGSFLHISTTIFFETNPEHLLNYRKIVISLVGVAFAVLAEFFL